MVRFVEPLYMEVAVLYLKSKKYDPSIQKFIGYLKELLLNPDPAAFFGAVDEKQRVNDPN